MKSRKLRYDILLCCRLTVMIIVLATTPAWCVTIDLTGSPVSAINDTACVGTHAQDNLGCNAKEFTVNPVFSAAPDTPPMCVAGNNFDFLVDLQLSESNANRYDITFYTGQVNNAPDVNDSTKLCSASAFPLSLPSPWGNLDASTNTCADYVAAGDSIIRVNRIKVKCEADAAGYLAIPYTLAYSQNTGDPTCTPGTPSTYPKPTKSKCQTGTSSVSGTVKVFSGAYIDVTKQTLPDGDSQAFSFSASGPTGSTVIAQKPDGTYYPATASAGANAIPVSPATLTITDGQTLRFFVNALSGGQQLVITEASTTNWETTASITCSNITGTPNPTVNNANRTITTNLNTTNSAAACTITNTKRSRITLAKNVGVRVDTADQFTVSASNGGTLTGTTSATTSGTGSSASTTFYSSPNTALTLTDDKAAGPTALTGYISSLTCTNAFAGSGATPNSSLPNGLLTTSTNITPAPGDDITCTYTNTKKVNFTLRKTWVNALVSDAVNVTASGLTTLASTANTTSEIDTGGVQGVRVGDVITIGESFTSGSAANYNAVLSCTGNATALSGNVLTVNTTDTAIICTQTNTRKTATLILRKSWVNAIVNNAVNVTATGLSPLASVANTATEIDSDSPGQTVRAGDVITLGETFTTGSAANYSTALICTGTTGLSGTSLTVGSADTAVVCSYTNTYASQPLLSVLKSANKATVNPGEVIIYTVQIVNSGTGVGTNVVLTDDLSRYSSFGLNSYGAGIRFAFTDSTPTPSGLSLGTPEYSYTNGSSWFTSPLTDQGGGAPTGYDGLVTNWRIPMGGTLRPGGSFILNYQVIVK